MGGERLLLWSILETRENNSGKEQRLEQKNRV